MIRVLRRLLLHATNLMFILIAGYEQGAPQSSLTPWLALIHRRDNLLNAVNELYFGGEPEQSPCLADVVLQTAMALGAALHRAIRLPAPQLPGVFPECPQISSCVKTSSPAMLKMLLAAASLVPASTIPSARSST